MATTPTSPWAALQASVNSAVLAGLCNVQVTVDGAQYPGIFDRAYSHGDVGGGTLGGMASTQPVVAVTSEAVPEDYDQMEIAIDGAPYLVVAAEPDGMGMTRLLLEAIAA